MIAACPSTKRCNENNVNVVRTKKDKERMASKETVVLGWQVCVTLI